VPSAPTFAKIQSCEPAQASLENLYRIFTVPESPESTLGRIDQAISDNLMGFLQDHIVAVERDLAEIERDFSQSRIPEDPSYVSTYTEFLKEKVVSQSVHTASPGFIGHMTSALPNFMLPLSRILIALNQNLVKVETSRAFTPMERQVLGMLHRLVYGGDDGFYGQWMQDSRHALGAFCSGGTVANITALWAARNRLFRPEGDFRGIAQEGMCKAMEHLGCKGLAVLVSRRGHYSLGKSVDVLGIGRDNLIAVDTDDNNRIDMKCLRQQCARLKAEGIRPLPWSGSRAPRKPATSTRSTTSPTWRRNSAVISTWMPPGAARPVLRHLQGRLKGIERADSVTIDAHKQMYVPMGAGMVLFKDPTALAAIEHHAAYILREGSRDLGSHTLEGSRPGMAMLVHAGLSIIGRKGYEILIDRGIERAHRFARSIDAHPDFELITEPELNILTYRYNPAWIQQELAGVRRKSRSHQRNPRQSHRNHAKAPARNRPHLRFPHAPRTGPLPRHRITVFRVVMANPLTTDEILSSVLEEQCEMAEQEEIKVLLEQIGG
jgi:glutamate decarboxylase